MVEIKSQQPYFLENSNYLLRDGLEGKLDTDILIVGAGLAGISTAYALSRIIDPSSITIIDSGQVGASTTGMSSGLLVDSVEEDFCDMDGEIHAEVQKGVEGVIKAIESEQISCGFTTIPGLYMATERSQICTIMREYVARVDAGFNVKYITEKRLSDGYGNAAFAAMVNEEGHCFNPYAFCQELAKVLERKGVKIYEGTKLTAYDRVGKRAQTKHTGRRSGTSHQSGINADITYEKLVLTNTSTFLEKLRRKSFLFATSIAVTEPLSSIGYDHIFGDGEYLGWDSSGVNYVYFRPIDGRLMVGGSDRLVSTSEAKKGVFPTEKDINALRQAIERIFPIMHFVQFSHVWTGIIPSSVDTIPLVGEFEQDHYFGLYSPGLPNAFRAGQILAQNISGESDENLFRYDRAIPLSKRIRALAKYEPFTTIANMFCF